MSVRADTISGCVMT